MFFLAGPSHDYGFPGLKNSSKHADQLIQPNGFQARRVTGCAPNADVKKETAVTAVMEHGVIFLES